MTTIQSVMSAGELCRALKTEGFVLSAEMPSTLSASGPRARMTESIASAIRYHKRALITVLAGRDPEAPHACSFCEMEFVSVDGQNCATCESLRGKPLRFAPGSIEETAFLVALTRKEEAQRVGEELSQLSQSGEQVTAQTDHAGSKSGVNPLRNDRNNPNHVYRKPYSARAQEEVSGNGRRLSRLSQKGLADGPGNSLFSEAERSS